MDQSRYEIAWIALLWFNGILRVFQPSSSCVERSIAISVQARPQIACVKAGRLMQAAFG